jgi:hypothetical protein
MYNLAGFMVYDEVDVKSFIQNGIYCKEIHGIDRKNLLP